MKRVTKDDMDFFQRNFRDMSIALMATLRSLPYRQVYYIVKKWKHPDAKPDKAYVPDSPKEKIERPPCKYTQTHSPYGIADELHNRKFY